MATVNPIPVIPSWPADSTIPRGVHVYKWSSVNAGDTCTPLSVPQFSDRSFQIFLESGGAFGDGSVAIKGTLEPGTLASNHLQTLRDPGGTSLSGITSELVKQILENVYQIAPVISGTTLAGVSIYLLITTVARN